MFNPWMIWFTSKRDRVWVTLPLLHALSFHSNSLDPGMVFIRPACSHDVCDSRIIHLSFLWVYTYSPKYWGIQLHQGSVSHIKGHACTHMRTYQPENGVLSRITNTCVPLNDSPSPFFWIVTKLKNTFRCPQGVFVRTNTHIHKAHIASLYPNAFQIVLASGCTPRFLQS